MWGKLIVGVTVALFAMLLGLVPFALKQGSKADTRGFAVILPNISRDVVQRLIPDFLQLPNNSATTHPVVLLYQYMHEEQPIPKYLAGPPFPLTYFELIVGVPSLSLSRSHSTSSPSPTYFWNVAMYVNESAPDIFGRMLGFPKLRARFDSINSAWSPSEHAWHAGADAQFGERASYQASSTSFNISGVFDKVASKLDATIKKQATAMALEGTWLISTIKPLGLVGEIVWDWGDIQVWPVDGEITLDWSKDNILSELNGVYRVPALSNQDAPFGAFYFDASWTSFGQFFFI